MTKINALKVLLRAQACCARVPDRNIAERTRQAYGKTFGRMWQEGNLDPLRPNMARDTYNYRRAALLTGGRHFLEQRIAECVAAGERRDAVAVEQLVRELLCVVEKIEPAFDLEPPLAVGASPFDLPPSRFRQAESADRERGLNSKQHDLEHLPEGWDVDLWDTATAQAYKDWPHRDALAVHLLAGVRPEELVPGDASGWLVGGCAGRATHREVPRHHVHARQIPSRSLRNPHDDDLHRPDDRSPAWPPSSPNDAASRQIMSSSSASYRKRRSGKRSSGWARMRWARSTSPSPRIRSGTRCWPISKRPSAAAKPWPPPPAIRPIGPNRGTP